MPVYLPIAGLSIDISLLFGLGGLVGFLSGLFGVGGGFLLTPLLIFLGVPPSIAVASSANQVVGASVSGVIAHWRRGNVDFRMGQVLLVGGLIGSILGVILFGWLQRLGHVDIAIQIGYVVFLGLIGGIMGIDTLRSLFNPSASGARRKVHRHPWPGLPLKVKFPKSGLYISIVLPLGVGAVGGLLSAIMGVGGGFIMVPLMIYILEMPTKVVVGTSLFQIIFVTATVTILHAVYTHSVDIVLSMILLIGGVIGAQWGARFGGKLKAEYLQALLALVVLTVCVRLALALFIAPDDPYTLLDYVN